MTIRKIFLNCEKGKAALGASVCQRVFERTGVGARMAKKRKKAKNREKECWLNG